MRTCGVNTLFSNSYRKSWVLIDYFLIWKDMWREHTVLKLISEELKISVIAFEYPGYGIAPMKLKTGS